MAKRVDAKGTTIAELHQLGTSPQDGRTELRTEGARGPDGARAGNELTGDVRGSDPRAARRKPCTLPHPGDGRRWKRPLRPLAARDSTDVLDFHPRSVSADHHQNWLDCIRSRRAPVCDVQAGRRSTDVCHLGNIAYWTGRSLKWDPVREEFPGDDEANRLRTRPYRAPWHL